MIAKSSNIQLNNNSDYMAITISLFIASIQRAKYEKQYKLEYVRLVLYRKLVQVPCIILANAKMRQKVI